MAKDASLRKQWKLSYTASLESGKFPG